MTAKLTQATTRKTFKLILLVCSLKLSILEIKKLEDLLVYVSRNSQYKLLVPMAKDETFYFLVHMLSVCGCNVDFIKPVRCKPAMLDIDAVKFLGKHDTQMLANVYDKIVLVGDSTRLDNLFAYLSSKNKACFVIKGDL